MVSHGKQKWDRGRRQYILIKLQAVDTIRVAIEINGSGLTLPPPLGQFLGCSVRMFPVDVGLNHGNTKPGAWYDRFARSIGASLFAQIRLPPDVLGAYYVTPGLADETSSGQARSVEVGQHLDGKLGG